MIGRRPTASSSFVLAAARLRALQLDPLRPGSRTRHLRGRTRRTVRASPAEHASHRARFLHPLDKGGPHGCRGRYGFAGLFIPAMGWAQCRGMMNFPGLRSAASDCPAPQIDPLRLAAAAYLARFTGSSREHTESGLRCYLSWCADRALDPLAARRPHLELYIRWRQEIRRFK